MESDLAERTRILRSRRQLPGPQQIVAQVAAALPRDGALIDIVAFRPRSVGALKGQPRKRPMRYVAFVLLPGGGTAAFDLGSASSIDRAAAALLRVVGSRPSSGTSADISYLVAAQALYRKVFFPLRPLLVDRRHVLIAADGALGMVPFAALHDGKEFLADKLEIGYLTSGRDLLRSYGGTSPPSQPVVVGDPAFDVAPSAQAAGESPLTSHGIPVSGGGFIPLPGARAEVEAIHRLLPHARVLTGQAANKTAFLALSAPVLLHVATHGLYLPDEELTMGRGPDLGTGIRPMLREATPNPLLRSMLVLAGANAVSGDAQVNGLVTALEVAGMNLWGTQLVVLSSCSSGKGESKIGEGVYGLRRALMIAGAETLVASLWPVDDLVTRDLMEDYYRLVLKGRGRLEALQEASQNVRRARPHPYFWAPFIVIGRPGPLRL